jgi:hypothetical protein
MVLRWSEKQLSSSDMSKTPHPMRADGMPVGVPPYGERCATAKLTLKQAIEISHSTETTYALAEKYGVHRTTISNIKNGKRWAYEIARAESRR